MIVNLLGKVSHYQRVPCVSITWELSWELQGMRATLDVQNQKACSDFEGCGHTSPPKWSRFHIQVGGILTLGNWHHINKSPNMLVTMGESFPLNVAFYLYGDLGTSLSIFCHLLCYITCLGDTLFSIVCFHRQSLKIVCLHSLFSDWNLAAVAILVCVGTWECQPQRRHRLMNNVTVSTQRDGLYHPSNSDWALPNIREDFICVMVTGESLQSLS